MKATNSMPKWSSWISFPPDIQIRICRFGSEVLQTIGKSTPSFQTVRLKKEQSAKRRPACAMLQPNYWRSFKTDCCAWLDCDSAAMPVCCSTLNCVIRSEERRVAHE